jgi:hypothetical protein
LQQSLPHIFQYIISYFLVFFSCCSVIWTHGLVLLRQASYSWITSSAFCWMYSKNTVLHLCLASLRLQSSHLWFPCSWNEKRSHDAQLLLTDMVSCEFLPDQTNSNHDSPKITGISQCTLFSHCLIKMYHVLYYVASFPCLCMYNFL